jgi:hypothetical protein
MPSKVHPHHALKSARQISPHPVIPVLPAITDPVRRDTSPDGAADRMRRSARAPFHAARGLDMDPEDNDSMRHRARLMGQLIQRVTCDVQIGARRLFGSMLA